MVGGGGCSESQGGRGAQEAGGGDWTGRDPSSIHSFPATLLLLKRLPSSALTISLFHNNNPITTTLSVHTPKQFASRLQIYSTSASPRYLNTPISVRRHLCRPSLPMSIENLKSYGQSF